jgi:hypothetical protein
MPFMLRDTSGNRPLGKLESFWLFYDFGVDKASNIVTVNNGYFAVYFSHSTAAEPVGAVDPSHRQFELKDAAGKSLKVDHATVVKSRKVGYGNERGQLHLFDLNNAVQEKKGWFDGAGWAPGFTKPTAQQGGAPLESHEAGLGTESPVRHAFGVMSDGAATTVDRLAVVMPLLANSFFATLLQKDGKPMSALSVTTPRGTWTHFDQPPLPDGPTGYAMIAAGVFKGVDVLSRLASWHLIKPRMHREFAEMLAEVIDQASPLQRNLDTAEETQRDGVIQATPRGPVEVLYLTGLASANQVL